VGEVAEDPAVQRARWARVLRACVELERDTAALGGDHPHADQLGDLRTLLFAGHDALKQLERQGVSTVLITTPSFIAASADDQSSSGAVCVTIPARSSVPSSAQPASRGKSACGRWSPPCDTRMRARRE